MITAFADPDIDYTAQQLQEKWDGFWERSDLEESADGHIALTFPIMRRFPKIVQGLNNLLGECSVYDLWMERYSELDITPPTKTRPRLFIK